MTEPTQESLHVASQVKFPGRAVARTAIATLLTSIAVLNTLIPVVSSSVSGTALIWINSFAVIIATISGIITRIMAIPQVNEWLRSLNLSATK